jgi:putative intracellular protease/amidase
VSEKNLNPLNAKKPKSVAIVLSNPAVSTTTGWPVGFWWSELSHPYSQFTETGYTAADDVLSRGCKHDPQFIKLLENTRPVDEADPGELDGIVVAGGQGFAIRDGNLVTGQQNFSGGETARLIIETLGR